jgi:hypothetical protein
MADEIPDQNRISVWRLPDGCWKARIGPADRGLETGLYETPSEAIEAVAVMAYMGQWIFDPTWQPPPDDVLVMLPDIGRDNRGWMPLFVTQTNCQIVDLPAATAAEAALLPSVPVTGAVSAEATD